MLSVCVILVMVCVLGAGSLSGRGFFCRDPDTGKLYPANSTWPASSFCGNYHCKLRRKNITETEYAPSRQFNMTDVKVLGGKLTNEDHKKETVLMNTDKFEKSVINIDKKTEPDIKNNLLLISTNIGEKIDDSIDDKNDTETDRYLSEKEIRSLTEMLQSVKKSDLDAIIEIYNLAQDIYKEIDKTSTDSTSDETLNTIKTAHDQKAKDEIIRNAKIRGHVSYWYEPLANGKTRPTNLLRTDISRSETIRNNMNSVVPLLPADMEEQATNVVSVAQKPTSAILGTLPPIASQMRRKSEKFFNGPLSNTDFRKLPYYYPMSSFQRLSSYVHEQQQYKTTSEHNIPVAKLTYKQGTYKPVYAGGKLQKDIKPSILLPYPFSSIHHYNWSYPQNIYHRNDRYDEFELPKKGNNQHVIRTNGQKPNNVVLMNPDLENFQDLEIRPSWREEKEGITDLLDKIREKRRNPNWHTESLPHHILEEVRAHIQEKQGLLIRPFAMRKKVKLERVGKLIKMDEITRTKRSNNVKNTETEKEPLEPQLYEVYIEKTTCTADYAVPGFFRYGNLSEPFPGCCPQRISAR